MVPALGGAAPTPETVHVPTSARRPPCPPPSTNQGIEDPGRTLALAEDAAFIVMLFSGAVLVVALIVAAIVI